MLIVLTPQLLSFLFCLLSLRKMYPLKCYLLCPEKKGRIHRITQTTQVELLVLPLHQRRALISRPEVKTINSACICYRHMRGMLNRRRSSFVKVKGVFFNLAKISIPTLCFFA